MTGLEDEYHFYYRKHGRDPSFLYDSWKELLESGHSPNDKWASRCGPRRVSALFSAVLDASLQLTELLVHYGAHLNEHNQDGWTVLQEAIILGHQDIVQLLLNRGANIESEVLSGFLRGGKALHLAVIGGQVEIMRSLLHAGAETRVRTEVGWIPADIAVLDHQTTALQILLTGVNPVTAIDQALDVEDHAGQSVKDHNNRKALASHLLEHGVTGAEREHLLFFKDCMSKVVEQRDSSVMEVVELSTLLVRDMESLLQREAGVSGDISWPRNLCDLCERFESQDSYNSFKIYSHQQDLTSLEASSNNGCNMCHFLMAAIKHHWRLLQQVDKKWLTEFGVSPRVRLRIHRKGRDNPHRVLGQYILLVVCGDKIAFMEVEHVQKHLNLAITSTGPSDTGGTASERSLAIAKAWLQRCEDEHPSCQQSELGRLPTRVIDVGDVSSQPRVYVSDRERVPYVALSYCWGQRGNIRLLSTNIDEYTQCLPLALLPQTIADAISVARRMNSRYLWVDSLCILQDSKADLEQQLSYMGDIFANTWFTIAAKDSPSSASGLFHARNWPTSAVVPTGVRLPSRTIQREAGIHGRMLNTRTSCFNRLMALPRPYQSRESDETPVLETRGWALQEDLLSRRMLNFGRYELSWTCLEGSCTERHPHEDDIRGHRKWQWTVKRVSIAAFVEFGNLNRVDKEAILNRYFDAVNDFVRRQLSESRDKLAAIAGVQGAVGKILEDDPIAGIWQGQFFAPSLLWWIEKPQEDATISPLNCPSWSWASTSRPVKYVKDPSCTDDSRPWVWHNQVKYFPEVVSKCVDDSRIHDVQGYLTVRCKMLREADLDCERYLCKDFLNRPPRSQHAGKEAIHFETHHDFEDAATILDSWLMLVRTNQFIPGTKDRGRRYDIQTHLLRLEKIASEQVDFRRIGLVFTRSWANKWLQHATEETIRLF